MYRVRVICINSICRKRNDAINKAHAIDRLNRKIEDDIHRELSFLRKKRAEFCFYNRNSLTRNNQTVQK